MKGFKIFVLTGWLFCAAFSPQAQKPEKIYSFVKVSKPVAYYRQQAALWEKEVRHDKKNADAWLNFYRARRNVVALTQVNPQNSSRFSSLDSLVGQMEKYVPGSFEFNYIKWCNGYNDASLFPYLEKAYKTDPERPETYNDLAVYYTLKGDDAQRDYFLKKLYEKNQESPGFMNYAYNLLLGMDKDAILLTDGDNGTFPAWILQAEKGIRTDVTIVNLSMLYHDEYRQRISKTLGINMPPLADQKDKENFRSQVIRQMAGNAQKRPLFVALTVEEEYIKPVKDSLYITGLAFLYSAGKIDNMALLKRNFEQVYALDYLKISFTPDISEDIVKQLNGNYIVPMLTLYDHYKLAGEAGKASAMKQNVLRVGRGTAYEGELEKYFQNN